MGFKLSRQGFVIIKVLYVIILVTILFQFTLAIFLINMELSKNLFLKVKQDSLVISSIYAAAYIKDAVNYPDENTSLTFQLLDQTSLELRVEEKPGGNMILLKINGEIIYNHYY